MHIPNPTPKLERQSTVWQKLQKPALDIEKFEALFESRAADSKAKVCADILMLCV